ncbi:MAG: ATP synthase F1 subunit epsilon [Candidatus Daviesbacteria bacterium]|nr:ATP synthase F1 subunit epsilon [Candidatus Daviesbacteria bacterium]
MTKLKLKIATPEKEIFDSIVDEVYVHTPEGEVGILPGHVNLMAQISPGELRIKEGGKINYLATGGGILQVSKNQVFIMTDLAEHAADIDEKMVEEAKKRAEDALEQKLDNEEYALTLTNLEKALAQLKVKRRFRSRI